MRSRGFTRQPENSTCKHLTALPSKKPPKIQREDPQRETKERKWGWERATKERIFGPHFFLGLASTLVAPLLGAHHDTHTHYSDPNRLDTIRLATIGQNPIGQNLIGQKWSKQGGQNGIGPSLFLPSAGPPSAGPPKNFALYLSHCVSSC